MSNKNGGFWLQHSVPHFPPVVTEKKYSYPHTGIHNGQMFSCMAFPSVDPMADILEIIKPHVYNASIPTEYDRLLPKLKAFVEKHDKHEKLKSPGFFRRILNSIRRVFRRQQVKVEENNHDLFEFTNGDRTMRIFAKGPSFQKGIYIVSQVFTVYNFRRNDKLYFIFQKFIQNGLPQTWE